MCTFGVSCVVTCHIPRAFWETPYIVIRHSGGRLWDLGHANSLEETDDNGVIVSLRAPSQAIKINRDTGKIEWRLGGESADFKIINDPHGRFIGQHDIRAPGGNRITVFDNAQKGGGLWITAQFAVMRRPSRLHTVL
ncbi:unnamed protein product [Vitrella brassicaformis CCMP3155]|uniref:Uncharacterized protein n=1 Tax=Vitrella brassicaformis (strain CCMP3155) TaxID=1169540 RepID=A0A0G4GLT0_VITBC|nr:unnamed protein product [Vitrella brassicaformis CCMP3155]|eukprot:CEM31074.1 unnamed protein product [Vitrella brassicaformis CCMP3155]